MVEGRLLMKDCIFEGLSFNGPALLYIEIELEDMWEDCAFRNINAMDQGGLVRERGNDSTADEITNRSVASDFFSLLW